MAAILLDRDECRDLPRVCIVCGADATTESRQTFRWHPPWVIVLILIGVLIWVIVALVMTKSMTVAAPVCDQHRSYWQRRKLIAWLPVLSGLGLFGVGVALMTATGNANPSGQDLGLYVMMAGALWFVLALIVVAVFLQRGVRPTEITDHKIRLAGVSPSFVDAVRDRREADREHERSRRRERDEEYEAYKQVRVRQRNESRSPGGPPKFNDYQ